MSISQLLLSKVTPPILSTNNVKNTNNRQNTYEINEDNNQILFKYKNTDNNKDEKKNKIKLILHSNKHYPYPNKNYLNPNTNLNVC